MSRYTNYKKELDKIGNEFVPKYKQSLVNNKRVATGRTKNSIRFETTENKITFYALDHTRTLETGQTPQEVREDSRKADFFQQIEIWARARQIRRSTSSIVSGLLEKGWEGSPGIITTIDDLLIARTKETISKDSKSQILNSMKATKRN